MNKKLEDKLAMLAFEDITPEEAKALELEAAHDPEAKVALFEYREMRQGLRAMADIPEHQLSTERLRNAILTQGLKPKSQSSFGWLWMPAAACALAFGFVAVRNMRSGSPLQQIGGSGSVAVAPANEGSIFVKGNSDDIKVGVKGTQVAEMFEGASVQPSVTLAMDRGEDTSRSAHRASRRQDRIDALNAAVAAQLDRDINSLESSVSKKSSASAAPGLSMESTRDMGSPAPLAFASRAGDSKPAAHIVVIDGTKDAATGAQRATEVDSSSNVLVGG